MKKRWWLLRGQNRDRDRLTEQLLETLWSFDIGKAAGLLDQGADINAEGFTLHGIINADEEPAALPFLQMLLTRGIDPDAPDENDPYETALHEAARLGQLEMAKLLLNAGADVDARDDSGVTPLDYALSHKEQEVAALLISAGAYVGLHEAVYLDDKQTVLARLEEGADINATDADNQTPLMVAMFGHTEIAWLLLERGANVNARNSYGVTALKYTSYSPDGALLAAALIERGAEVDARDNDGETALTSTAHIGNAEVIRVLAAHGADFNAKPQAWSYSPLDSAANAGRAEAVSALIELGADREDWNYALLLAGMRGYPDVVERLLEYGADPNVSTETGYSCLMWTAQNGDLRSAQALIRHSANIHAVTEGGTTALTVAAICDHPDIVQGLLAAGARVNLLDAALIGDTPTAQTLLAERSDTDQANERRERAFLWASSRGHVDIVRLLLESGVNVEAKWDKGETALIAAARNGHAHVMRLLIEYGADIHVKESDSDTTLLSLAAWKGNEEGVRMLLAAGADIHGTSDSGRSALISAAEWGHAGTIRALLEAGADLNARIREWRREEWTPLLLAAEEGHAEVVRILIERGASLHAMAEDGTTALVFAAKRGHTEVARLLLEAGARVDARAAEGRTALMNAAAGGHREVVRLLLAAGARVNLRDRWNWTALQHARAYEHDETAKLLEAAGAKL